ncbi:TPA: TrkA family potassium uptake protein [Candidatus Avacholeplasma faecigallinarum]|nr:TrkA family potassium uptake protein [Candidatus Avacholeplasma faecigallinarum]
MKKSFIVIGLGRFGASVAKALEAQNCDVLAMDIKEDSVSRIANDVSHCVIADSTNISALKDLGVASIDHAVVCIGNSLQASILTILNLKKLGVKRITVRADEEDHMDVYKMLGADDVIIPEEASAISLANQIISDNILDYYVVSADYAIVKLIVGKNFETKTLMELDIRNRFDINIVGILKSGEFYIPRGTDAINPNDVLVVVGKTPKIRKFDNFLNN